MKPHDHFIYKGDPVILWDTIFLDLGYSMYQLADKEWGLSYLWDEDYMDMRFDNSENPANPATAADLINNASPYELADIFAWFGEEKYARTIAG